MITMVGFAVMMTVSLLLNGALFYLYRRAIKSPPPQRTYEVAHLLQDLLAGNSLVRVQRVAPEDVFLRSPRMSHDD